MEAVAKHDFTPNDSNELGFNKGDKLLVLNYGDPTPWYNAEKDGEQGLVPGNYIHIEPPTWYLGRISRSEAEQMLQGSVREGAFLVRLSESAPTEFSLSVKCGNSVQHFRILKDNDSKYFLWSERFNSINELVEHYRRETVSRTSQIFLCDMDTDEFVVEAMYDFNDEPTADSELKFSKGELITVFDTSDNNWWGGRIQDRHGYFPRTYVKQYLDPNNHA